MDKQKEIWSFESIKAYNDSKLDELNIRIEQARLSMEKRLDSMNEFREALREQSAKSPTRAEVAVKFESIDKSLDELNTYKAIAESKAATWLVWVGLFFTGASFFFSIIGLILSLYATFWLR